jgi:hypothetical protein
MNLSQDELLSQLRQIDEYEFEELVADVWEQRGWQTTVTTGSSDRGIDVVAQKSSPFSQKHLIQAKRYSAGNKIGSPDIQQYSSLRQQEDHVDAIIVVTTSSFTSQAQQISEELNVKLVAGNELYDIIQQADANSIVYEYVKPIENKEQANKNVTSSNKTDTASTKTPDTSSSSSQSQTRGRRHQGGSIPDSLASSGPPEPGTSVDILDADTPPEPGSPTTSGTDSGDGRGTILLLWLISIIPTAILTVISIINFSIHNLLLPAGAVTLIMTVIFVLAFSEPNSEDSSTENSPPRGFQ